MSLRDYVRKRDFKKTAEPRGGGRAPAGRSRFVIQKHAASRLHYDFRLELGGTLKSWAVPKGVPCKKGERRLAVHVEDHPVSYIDFEGTIPPGQYGGGTVMVWDRGTFEPLSAAPLKELAGGKLHFVLHGEKLRGEWYLVRLREGDEWLLIKGGEDMKPVSAKADDTSVRSGKTMAQLASGKSAIWQSNRTGRKTFRETVAEAAHAAEATANGVGKTATKTPRRVAKKSGGARKTRARRKETARTPEFVEPMKAKLVDAAAWLAAGGDGSPSRPSGSDWIYEIKFDGFRAMAYRDAGGTRLLSRNRNDFAAKFPEIVAAIGALDVEDAVIDGEIVALDGQGRSSFQLLQAYELGQERPSILFYAFDLLQLNGRDLTDRPLAGRKDELERLLGDSSDAIRYSRSLGGEVEKLLEQARSLGLEGLIGKRPDSRYESGRRSGAWIKLKLHHEQEFVIGGYTPPAGSRQHFGALLVGVHEGDRLVFTGKVGTGFDAKLLRHLHTQFRRIERDACPFANLPEPHPRRYGTTITAAEMKRCHWLDPVLVAQLRFAEWTRDGRLRQPVFLGLREDKPAREVVREEAR